MDKVAGVGLCPKTEPKENATEEAASVEVAKVKLSYEQKVAYCSAIAKPMASEKLAKRCYKLIKKARKHKTYVRWGLKEVQSRLEKGETGIVIAGDVYPVDIMCHLPGICENKNIPYVSRKDLGAALGVKWGCITVLIRANSRYSPYEELFNELKSEISKLTITF